MAGVLCTALLWPFVQFSRCPLLKRLHSTDVETEAWVSAVIRAQGGATDKQWSQGWPKTSGTRSLSFHYAMWCHLTTFEPQFPHL